jgi:aldehyde:ferredoxin oxidoreductase
MCLFVAFAVLDDKNALEGLCEMIAAHTGHPFTGNELMELGKEVLRRERDFNTRAGFTAVHDRLPDFFRSEKLAPHRATFDVPDEELDTVFNF